MKTQSAILSLIVSAGLLAPFGSFAQPVTVQVDEGNFVNTISILYEESNILAGRVFGSDPADLTFFILNETAATNGFGIVDIHLEWSATSPFAPGVAQTFNFNIYDPTNEGGGLSDTLSLTLTGITPAGADLDNMSLDLFFRSDSLSETSLLLPLAGGIAIIENGFFQPVDAFLPSDFVLDPNSPLSVSFRSDVVPEPGAFQLGLLGLVALPFLRRLCVKL